jgi:hypothetical protein
MMEDEYSFWKHTNSMEWMERQLHPHEPDTAAIHGWETHDHDDDDARRNTNTFWHIWNFPHFPSYVISGPCFEQVGPQ